MQRRTTTKSSRENLLEFKEIFGLVDKDGGGRYHQIQSYRTINCSFVFWSHKAAIISYATLLSVYIDSISSNELGELFQIVGIEATEDELVAIIRHIDKDDSGEIDFEGEKASSTNDHIIAISSWINDSSSSP